MWQTGVVIIVLAVAVGYAAWRIYRTLTYKGDGCEVCALKEICMKHGGKHIDHDCGKHNGHDCCKNGGHACPNC